jgi:dCTP deaminase
MGGIKSDKWIKMMAKKHKMIEPFEESRIIKGVISYGLGSYGYDIRLAGEYRVFKGKRVVDPKNPDGLEFEQVEGNYCLIPPNSFILGRSIEYFRIPRNIITICIGKSTYARCGIVVNVTPFEPEWEGYATLHIANNTPCFAKVYANEGIAQILFLEADEVCQTSYKDKKGRYNKQKGIQPPQV